MLSRISGILAARGFNIDSLVVCNTEVGDLSRMNIVLRGQDGVVEQARRQLEDLVPVWVVLDYTQSKIVERELLLAKVSILGPEHFHELIAHHREDLQAEDERHDEENTEVDVPLNPHIICVTGVVFDVGGWDGGLIVGYEDSRWTVSSSYSGSFRGTTT